MPSRPSSPLISSVAFIAVLLAGQLVFSLVWIGQADTPLGLYEIAGAQDIASRLIGDWPGLLENLKAHTYYPPGYDMGLGLVLASGLDAPYAVLLFNWILACIGCWGLIRLSGRPTGYWAAAIFSLLPSVCLSMRVSGREFVLTCLLPPFLAAVSRSQGLTNRRSSVEAALWLTAAMYVKWTFIGMAVIPAVAYLAASGRPFNQELKRRAINLAVGAAICLGLCAPWYIGVLDYHGIAFATVNDPSDLPGLQGLIYYPKVLFDTHLLWWGCIACAAALPLALWRNPKQAIPAAFWIAGPIVVFSLLVHKEARYIQPVVPACAAIIALGLGALPKVRITRPIVGALILVLGASSFVQDSYYRPIIMRDSGTRLELSSLGCLALSKDIAAWLDEVVTEHSPEGTAAKAVLHPLSRNDIYMGQEVLSYRLSTEERKAQEPWSVEVYNHERLGEFICAFPEIRLLLVPDQLSNTTLDTQDSMARGWLSEQDPRLEGLIDWDDPALLAEVQRSMQPVSKFVSDCVYADDCNTAGITLYKRVNPSPDPPAECGLGLLKVPRTL